MVELSIIIVNWNTRQLLLQCLQSLVTHTDHISMEIIVVDNASTDDSVAAVKNQYPGVKLICNDRNVGFAKANNIGIRQSTGRYVCLVNSDIVILDDALKQMWTYLNENPAIGITAPMLLYKNLTPQVSCKKFPTLWNNFCIALGLDKVFPGSKLFGGEQLDPTTLQTQPVDVVSGAFMVVRRAALEQVGLLDESFFFYGEDVDWCKRFWRTGWQVTFFPQVRVIHYEGSSSTVVAPVKYFIELRRARLNYWKKHHNRSSQICYSGILVLHLFTRIIGQVILYLVKPSSRDVSLLKLKRSYECTRWLLHNS